MQKTQHLQTSFISFRLALRNTIRHRVRTTIAVAAISFGVAALLIAGGFIEWLLWAMRESTIESRLGHVQIVKSGYFDSGIADPFRFLLPKASKEFDSISTTPHVQTVARRLNFSGLISYGETTLSFIGEGVEPDKEKKLSKAVAITKGKDLSAKDSKGIIIGEGLASSLGVKPGDTVVLLSNTKSGGVNGVEVHINGLFSTYIKAFDDAAIRVPIDTAREILRVTGSHAWVVLLDKTESTPAVTQQFKENFKQSNLQIVPWSDLADFYNKTASLFSRQVGVVYMIIALVIVLSISNTLIMSVLERTGEIGTLMATGTKRKKILQMFISEGFILGVIGGVCGLCIGIPLAHVLSLIGIPMPPPPGSNRGFMAEIMVTNSLMINALVLAIVTTLLASIYPAWKASRLIIVDALRHNR